MKIIICDRCDGTGMVEEHIPFSREDGEDVPCLKCNKTGRLVYSSYSFVVPFGTPNKKINKADSNIIAIIRKVEGDYEIF
jgi:hypothetical protein